jgi:hypothetical protein
MTDTQGMYEQRRHRLLAWRHFLRRAAQHLSWALLILGCAVAIGTFGYHVAGRLAWIDAFLNASMILSGMGPVDRMETQTAKLFAAFYALFSGLLFIGVAGLLVAPWLHRLFHWIHLEKSE